MADEKRNLKNFLKGVKPFQSNSEHPCYCDYFTSIECQKFFCLTCKGSGRYTKSAISKHGNRCIGKKLVTLSCCREILGDILEENSRIYKETDAKEVEECPKQKSQRRMVQEIAANTETIINFLKVKDVDRT